ARLERLGRSSAGRIEQVKTWERSSVLRLTTTDGTCYFKALPAMYAQEALLTEALARRFPGQVPQVLAIDRERRWLLMEAFDGQPLDRVSDLGCWAEALRALAQIQIQCAGFRSRLLAWGCPDRSLDSLAARIRPLLADTAAMLPGDEAVG